jgi:hypothetical protein
MGVLLAGSEPDYLNFRNEIGAVWPFSRLKKKSECVRSFTSEAVHETTVWEWMGFFVSSGEMCKFSLNLNQNIQFKYILV